jgi:hypothetical protein
MIWYLDTVLEKRWPGLKMVTNLYVMKRLREAGLYLQSLILLHGVMLN